MIFEPFEERRVPFREWETWYRISGDPDSTLTPLVVVHGGPGCPHDYLLSISALSANGRRVIHYDQVGCGNSAHLPDKGPGFWTVQLFLDELDNLLTHLGIAHDYHLLGQSWGGMLGAEHAILQPSGLRSLVLSNSPASMELWIREATRLRAGLSTTLRETLDRHESDGTVEDPEYVAATQAFYDEHVCRVVPNPPEVARAFALLAKDPTVYSMMNGPNEFFCIGTLKSWSVVDRISAINVPTLLASGRFDEATPATVKPFFELIPDVRWEMFDLSSHMPFVEEPERYLQVVGEFLALHDGPVAHF